MIGRSALHVEQLAGLRALVETPASTYVGGNVLCETRARGQSLFSSPVASARLRRFGLPVREALHIYMIYVVIKNEELLGSGFTQTGK